MHPHHREAKSSRSEKIKKYHGAQARSNSMPPDIQAQAEKINPNSPDALKHGGKVHGKKAHARMDKKPRGKKMAFGGGTMIPGRPGMAPAPMPMGGGMGGGRMIGSPVMGRAPMPMGGGMEGRPRPGFMKKGGKVEKRAHGGRVKKPAAVVNVMIGKPGNDQQQNGINPAVAAMAMQAAQSQAQPQMPQGAPSQPMPQQGMPVMKRGGRVGHTGEASRRTEEMRAKMSNKSGYRSGGRVKSYPKMDDGAMSGEGRLEKIEKYGKNAKP